eukprot:160654-Chlamydomonas_euryale.AAC.3
MAPSKYFLSHAPAWQGAPAALPPLPPAPRTDADDVLCRRRWLRAVLIVRRRVPSRVPRARFSRNERASGGRPEGVD